MAAKGIVAYVIFTSLTEELLQRGTTSAHAMAVAVIVPGTLAFVLSIRRVRHAGSTALSFEDEPPTDVIPLRLNGD
jgi:hypothetical protein